MHTRSKTESSEVVPDDNSENSESSEQVDEYLFLSNVAPGWRGGDVKDTGEQAEQFRDRLSLRLTKVLKRCRTGACETDAKEVLAASSPTRGAGSSSMLQGRAATQSELARATLSVAEESDKGSLRQRGRFEKQSRHIHLKLGHWEAKPVATMSS